MSGNATVNPELRLIKVRPSVTRSVLRSHVYIVNDGHLRRAASEIISLFHPAHRAVC